MQREVLEKLRNDPKMADYLKKNSYWIKELNRSSENYAKFVNAMKEKYRLKVSNRIEDAIDNIDLISEILSSLK